MTTRADVRDLPVLVKLERGKNTVITYQDGTPVTEVRSIEIRPFGAVVVVYVFDEQGCAVLNAAGDDILTRELPVLRIEGEWDLR